MPTPADIRSRDGRITRPQPLGQPIPDGPGQAASYVEDYLEKDRMRLYDKVVLNNCFGIVCGDFCGKCLHKCPSKKLCAKDLKDYDSSIRHSSINRSRL